MTFPLRKQDALSVQLAYDVLIDRKHIVIPIGFEPMTYCLEGSCSIQLS